MRWCIRIGCCWQRMWNQLLVGFPRLVHHSICFCCRKSIKELIKLINQMKGLKSVDINYGYDVIAAALTCKMVNLSQWFIESRRRNGRRRLQWSKQRWPSYFQSGTMTSRRHDASLMRRHSRKYSQWAIGLRRNCISILKSTAVGWLLPALTIQLINSNWIWNEFDLEKKKRPAAVFTYDGGPARRRCCRCCRFYGPGWINPDGIVTGPVWFWCGVRTRSTPWTVTLLRELYAGTPVAVYSDRWSLSCSSWWLLQLLMNSLYLCRWWRHWAARSAVCHSSTTLSTWRRWRHHLTPPKKKPQGGIKWWNWVNNRINRVEYLLNREGE